MKVARLLACVALATSATNAASIPEVKALDAHPGAVVEARNEILAPENTLEKRKGGGGGGGGGGGRGGGGGGGGGGGRGGGGKGGGGAPARNSPASNAGGQTVRGSGPPRAYGNYYAGGAAIPYSSGQRSKGKGIAPLGLLLPAAALALFPGLWLWGVYPYYLNDYRFYNRTRNETQTLPVVCLCQQYSVCGCDNNDNSTYLDDAIGDGRDSLNKTLLHVANVNGTTKLVLNGTLPNGTTAPGGTENGGATNSPTYYSGRIATYSGYWAMILTVVSIVTFL